MLYNPEKDRSYDETSWRAVGYFNLYRFLVAALFVSLIWIWELPDPLGDLDNFIFTVSAHVYLFSVFFYGIFFHYQRSYFRLQVTVLVLTDILLLSLMMYSSGGLSSGFGMLAYIAVAGGSLLTADKLSFLFAAVASISVLIQEIYIDFIQFAYTPNYIHGGFLGITFFTVAWLGYILARRVQESEALALQRAFDIEGLSRLNEQIVQRLQSGIVVLDNNYGVRLMNAAARRLLGLKAVPDQTPLEHLAPELAEKLNRWLYHGGDRIFVFKSPGSGIDLQVSLTRLRKETKFGILIFLEDMAQLRQRAQHMKLASLGRLAASIAHEVRNPLGAISHAGQLLSETGEEYRGDDRLLQIILDQSQRVNAIIENVQKISRRETAMPQEIMIADWLDEFCKEFTDQHLLERDAISATVEPRSLSIRMDATQLHQALWNLAENAMRYSRSKPLVEIRCTIKKETERPVIDVTDTGPGITNEVKEHLFEPFFTSDSRGSGLGLYIARELCEANQASLDLYSSSESGSCFRISLAHVEREHNLF